MKALIIGAGIGGLAAGIALQRAGHDVVVFERRADLSKILVGGGIILWANAGRALQQLGLADAVLPVGMRVTRAENCSSDGALLFEVPVREFEQRAGAPSLLISRAHLLPILEGALRAGTVRVNKTCTGFTQEAGAVTARFEDGSEERGDLLIAADGKNSRLRQQLGRAGDEFPPYAGWTHYSAPVPAERGVFPDGLFRIITGRGAQGYVFRMEPGKVYWAVGVWGPEVTRGREEGDPESKPLVQRVVRGWAEPLPTLVQATPAADVARRAMYGGRPLADWGQGRVTLLGDSAHPMTTTPGQGACTAIEDAVILARCLQGQPDVVAGLRAYEAQQQERSANWMSVSRQMENRVDVKSPIGVVIRNQIMRQLVGRLGLLKRSAYYREMMRAV